MTAIEKYIRLEAVGQWLEAGADTPVEVIVSFGDTTLQLTSLQDVPIAHWALLATKKVGTKGADVLYSADPDERDILAVSDPEMNRAIAAVTAAITQRRQRPKVLRWVVMACLLMIIAVLAFYSPPYIYRWGTALTSPLRSAQISRQMISELDAAYGPQCKNWQSVRDLDSFVASLLKNPPDIRVYNMPATAPFALPSGVIILPYPLTAGSPVEIASTLNLAVATTLRNAALETSITELGPFGGLRYLMGGGDAGLSVEAAQQVQLTGADYIVARNHLQDILWPTALLQAMAQQDGIGLHIGAQMPPPFQPDAVSLQSIRQICEQPDSN